MDNPNLIRELGKIQETLTKVQAHLYHRDAMNANLHMSDRVMSTPLYSAVESSLLTVDYLVDELEGEENFIENLRRDVDKDSV